MKRTARKQEIDVFCDKLLHNYKKYCQIHQLPEGLNSFTTYLIDESLIEDSAIRQYAITELFKELYPRNEYKKTRTVEQLASRFNLTTRSIWNVLRRHQKGK